MGQVVLDITMSLDGFIAGSDITLQQPMGKNGPRLHDWLFDRKTDTDVKLIGEWVASVGAVITGGRTYTIAIDDSWGGVSPFEAPAFVPTNKVPAKIVDGFTFVTDGIQSALDQAQAAAGSKNIWIMGGAGIAQEYLKAGLVDELYIHIAPILLGAGTRLFDHLAAELVELEKISSVDTPAATHLRFRVVK